MEFGVKKVLTAPVAHLMARLFSDRSVAIKKHPIKTSALVWVVSDGRAGFELHFVAPSEAEVRRRMAEVFELKVDPSLVAVEAAKQRLQSPNLNVIGDA